MSIGTERSTARDLIELGETIKDHLIFCQQIDLRLTTQTKQVISEHCFGCMEKNLAKLSRRDLTARETELVVKDTAAYAEVLRWLDRPSETTAPLH